MKQENPIEEIWRVRDELGAKEGYDVHQLFERLRREEKKHASRLVRQVGVRALEGSVIQVREEPPKPE